MYVAIGGVTIGVLGVLFGARCYLELWRWARMCQHARIAVSYKRKVAMQAPIVEWIAWCNQLMNDQASHGRVVYAQSGVRIAIAKPVLPPSKITKLIRSARRRKVTEAPRSGSWKVLSDDTDKTKTTEVIRNRDRSIMPTDRQVH